MFDLFRAIEAYPHWGFLLQMNVIISITLIMVQIKNTEHYEYMRRCNHGFWGAIRKATLFVKMLALCWAVVYGHDRGWQPWPPFVVVMACFNIHIVARIMIMRQDIARIKAVRETHSGVIA